MGILDDLDQHREELRQKDEREAHKLFQLGRRYMAGDGVEQDKKKAVWLYRKALSLWEDAEIDYAVGCCYNAGIGVDRDPETAKRFLRRGTVLYPEILAPLTRLEIETKELEAALYYGRFAARQDEELAEELERIRTGQAEGRRTSQQCLEQLRAQNLYEQAYTVYHYAVDLLQKLLDTGSSILDYKINIRLNRYVENDRLLWEDAVFWAVLAQQFTDGNIELQVSVSIERALAAACLSLIASYRPEDRMPLPNQPWREVDHVLKDALAAVRGGNFSPDILHILHKFEEEGNYHAIAQLRFLAWYIDTEKDTESYRIQQLQTLCYPPASKKCLLMAAAALEEQDPESCLELARVLFGKCTGDLENAPAGSLLTGVYFMCAVQIYEQRTAQGDWEAYYHLAKAHGSMLLEDTEKYTKWMMEGVQKGYAPCIIDVVEYEAAVQSAAAPSDYRKYKMPASLLNLAKSVPDNFYCKKELIRSVEEIKDKLRMIAKYKQQEYNARVQQKLAAEEKAFKDRLDQRERTWNAFVHDMYLTAEERATLNWVVGNTDEVYDYTFYKTSIRDVKEKKNRERLRQEIDEEEAERRAANARDPEPGPEPRGPLSAALFPEPKEAERWVEESGLGDTWRLLDRLEPFDYDRANELFHASKVQEAAGMGHKIALFQTGKILEAALLWYGPAMVAYYRKNPDTELGRDILYRAVVIENPDAEFEQAKLWLNQEGTEGAGVVLLKKLSNLGRDDAKELLGVCYYKGLGVEKNPAMAIFFMEEAAKKANPSACAQLGAFYEGGLNGPPDIPNAIRWYEHAAQMGRGDAVCRLAKIYLEGKAVGRDYLKGLGYCVQGVLLGDKGCTDLFESLDGETVGDLSRCYPHPKPAKKGFFLFYNPTPGEQAFERVQKERKKTGRVQYSDHLQLAAEEGVMEAQELLAALYLKGSGGVRKSDWDAYLWYTRAAQQGSPLALQRLAWWFDAGVRGFYNEKLARLYARLAEERGGREYAEYWKLDAPQGVEGTRTRTAAGEQNAEMSFRLGRACAGEDEEEAFRSFLSSAKGGHPMGQLETGFRYSIGRGVAQNLTQAVYWYRKSADQGNAQAMFNLGVCYANGEGVAKDAEESFRWYERSARAGHADGQKWAGYCCQYGQGTARDTVKAVDWYKKAAEQKNADAMQLLGVCYQEGEGVGIDQQEAFRWFERSAQAGSPFGQLQAGYCYETGSGTARNVEQAAVWYRKSAEQGNVTAMYNLGVCYESGRGIPADEEKAFYWYERSAQAGNADGQLKTGYRFEVGKGTQTDLEQCVFWYRKSAEQGNATAMCNMGLCCEVGRGMAVDLAQAVEWYQKSAEAGNTRALYRMGLCYEYGKGVEKDGEKAFYWYERSAQAGNLDGQLKTGYLFDVGKGVAQDQKKAVYWYQKSAEQGNTAAMRNLGLCYANGEGVEKDEEKAVYWYQNAAERGNDLAMNNLGVCYKKGKGVGQDLEQAAGWYRKAAEKGNTSAMCNLGNLYLEGEGVEKSPETAVTWFQRAAAKDFARGKYLLARCLLDGNGIALDREAATELLQAAVKQNYKAAQELLNKMNAAGES